MHSNFLKSENFNGNQCKFISSLWFLKIDFEFFSWIYLNSSLWFLDTVAFHAVIAEILTIEYDTTVIFPDVQLNTGDG